MLVETVSKGLNSFIEHVAGIGNAISAALYFGKFPTFRVDKRLYNYASDALNDGHK